MKTLLKKLTFTLVSFSGLAQAQVSDDLKDLLPTHTIPLSYTQQSYDSVVDVRGVVFRNRLYAKPLYIEVEIANLDWRKEIYVVNSTHLHQKHNRETQAMYISDVNRPSWMSNESMSGHPQVMYVGEAHGHKSRFLILAPGGGPNAFVDLYVKMGNRQFHTRIQTQFVR